jgi:hypothetical protein
VQVRSGCRENPETPCSGATAVGHPETAAVSKIDKPPIMVKGEYRSIQILSPGSLRPLQHLVAARQAAVEQVREIAPDFRYLQTFRFYFRRILSGDRITCQNNTTVSYRNDRCLDFVTVGRIPV